MTPLRKIFLPKSKMKVSLQINILLFILFCGVFISGYTTINQLKIFQDDASTINNLGIIRGSIQRITKRELNQINSDNLIRKVDELLLQEKTNYLKKSQEITQNQKKSILEMISNLNAAWHELKSQFYIHRKNQNDFSNIISSSEDCWDKANAVVYAAQKISERKHFYYKSRVIITLITSCVFILCIIYLVHKIVHKNLEVKVITDPLTKLFNKNYFNEILRQQINIKSRYDTPFSLILCDVDFFKSINDEFGHQKGDKVLFELAKLFKTNARENDYVFRIGGEEFAIIFPQTSQSQATVIAEKYRHIISKQSFGLNRALTISIGVSEYLKDESAEALFRRADSALYQAKSSGRNRVVSEIYQHTIKFQ